MSNRELQVYELLKMGWSNVEIAHSMSLSQKTIGAYKARLMEKFSVRTTPELLARLQNRDSRNQSDSRTSAPESA